MRKRLNTLALDGERLGLIDNLIGTWISASLAAFLTAPRWGDRVLGGTQLHPAEQGRWCC